MIWLVQKKSQSLVMISIAMLVLFVGVQSAEARRGKGLFSSSTKSSTPAIPAKPQAAKAPASGSTVIIVSVPTKSPAIDPANSGPPPAFRNTQPLTARASAAAGAGDEPEAATGKDKTGVNLPVLGASAVFKGEAAPGFLLLN